MTTTANGQEADPGAPGPGSGGAGLMSPKGFGWGVIAVVAGLVYGNVTRAAGCPMPSAAGAGVAAGLAVLYWLDRFDWHDLFTTRRGWILLAGSGVCAVVAVCIPLFTIAGDNIWMKVLGLITAAAIGFGGALGAADHFVHH
ncbi:hypothetical protein [Nocardia sp. NBC_00416]|uniref:hypothetical protein n=1 Tax=Nocardia sp. NBC_00416 TaxID=2975991 RepID=UPI002E215B6D